MIAEYASSKVNSIAIIPALKFSRFRDLDKSTKLPFVIARISPRTNHIPKVTIIWEMGMAVLFTFLLLSKIEYFSQHGLDKIQELLPLQQQVKLFTSIEEVFLNLRHFSPHWDAFIFLREIATARVLLYLRKSFYKNTITLLLNEKAFYTENESVRRVQDSKGDQSEGA